MKTNKISYKLFIGLWLIFGFLSLSVFIGNETWRTVMDETRKEVIAIKNNKNPKKFAIRKHSTPLNQKNNSKTIIVKRNKEWKKR
jgi:hypothetical protein